MYEALQLYIVIKMRLRLGYLSYLFLLHISNCLTSVGRDYAMSVAGLRSLIDLETLFIAELEGFTKALQLKIEAIECFLAEVSSKKAEWEQSAEAYVAHPLNSYSLIRRLHEDWSYFELYMSQPVGEVYVENIKRLVGEEAPQQLDLEDAMDAIIRLQSYYDLNAANLTQGLIDGRQYSSQLTVLDTFCMAQFCHEWQINEFVLGWYKESLNLFNNNRDDKLWKSVYKLTDTKVYGDYSNLLAHKGYYVDALNVLNKVAHLNAELWLRQRPVEEMAFYFNNGAQFIKEPLDPIQVGCSGKILITRNLTCHFQRNFSHYLILAPLKVETLSLDPYVVLFHNVIYQREIQELKGINVTSLKHERAEYHKNSMKQTTLEKEEKDVLNYRVKDMTGLQIGNDKDFTLMNFGLGGHITLPLDEQLPKVGYSRTSIIFFLSDVLQGGATVFPKLQITVKPIKGAALLWHTLNSQQSDDYITEHLSCPVVVGSKWILAKWLHEGTKLLS